MSKLRQFREELGLSISRLSQEAKVNASVLSWVELGKRAASPAMRTSLAGFYKTPEAALFNEAGLAK